VQWASQFFIVRDEPWSLSGALEEMSQSLRTICERTRGASDP